MSCLSPSLPSTFPLFLFSFISFYSLFFLLFYFPHSLFSLLFPFFPFLSFLFLNIFLVFNVWEGGCQTGIAVLPVLWLWEGNAQLHYIDASRPHHCKCCSYALLIQFLMSVKVLLLWSSFKAKRLTSKINITRLAQSTVLHIEWLYWKSKSQCDSYNASYTSLEIS